MAGFEVRDVRRLMRLAGKDARIVVTDGYMAAATNGPCSDVTLAAVESATGPWARILPAATLAGMVKGARLGDIVSIRETVGGTVNIRCAGRDALIECEPADEEELEPTPVESKVPTWGLGGGFLYFSFDGDDAATVQQVAKRFASTDRSRPVLTCLNVEWREDYKAVVSATDSYRMAVVEGIGDATGAHPLSDDGDRPKPPTNVMLPASLLALWTKTDGRIHGAGIHGAAVIFTMGRLTFTCPWMDGEFPDWRRLMPAEWAGELVLPADKAAVLAGAAKAGASSAAAGRARYGDQAVLPGRTHTIAPGMIAWRSTGSTLEVATAAGSAAVLTPIDGVEPGPDAWAGFNAKFVADCLAMFPRQEVTIRSTDPLRPIIFTGGGNTRALLMPIRLGAAPATPDA